MTSRVLGIRSISPLAIQVLGSLAGAALLVVVSFSISSVVIDSSKLSRDESSAALLASEIRSDVFQLRALEARIDGAQGATNSSVAVEAHDKAEEAIARATEILRLTGSARALEIWGVSGEAHTSLDAYIENPSQANRDTLLLRLEAMQILVDRAVPLLAEEAGEHDSVLVQAAVEARTITTVAALLIVTGISLMAFVVSRRVRTTLVNLQHEKDSLSVTTQGLNRRNEQLSALYHVVTEVTDTLSLKYVVDTTIREARKLVRADVVVLRLLKGSQLEVAGISKDEDALESNIEALPLGVGLVGRAAKRGKTTRLDGGAEGQMADSEKVKGIESGVIVPLIVGAKVVGTLGCWAVAQNHFSSDDERILEMMASQVATAVVAAELHEVSDEMAHHDPLTGLPNRRQLTKDTEGYLRTLTSGYDPHAVAMIDIDHFKTFNDDFGHRVGDVTLQKVAEVLRASFREQDRIYRYGGEEFVVVFDGATRSDALMLAERVRRAVEHTSLTGDELQPVGPVTISIGVALFPEHSRDFDELLKLADIAMYSSKEAGRNRVTVYELEAATKAA